MNAWYYKKQLSSWWRSGQKCLSALVDDRIITAIVILRIWIDRALWSEGCFLSEGQEDGWKIYKNLYFADVLVSHEVDVSPKEPFCIKLDWEIEEIRWIYQSKRGILHEIGLRNGGNTLNLSVQKRYFTWDWTEKWRKYAEFVSPKEVFHIRLGRQGSKMCPHR